MVNKKEGLNHLEIFNCIIITLVGKKEQMYLLANGRKVLEQKT